MVLHEVGFLFQKFALIEQKTVTWNLKVIKKQAGVVLAVAPLISNDCQIYWYQDKEPEGLEKFARRRR